VPQCPIAGDANAGGGFPPGEGVCTGGSLRRRVVSRALSPRIRC